MDMLEQSAQVDPVNTDSTETQNQPAVDDSSAQGSSVTKTEIIQKLEED